jgi:hypothetical protein
MLATKNSQAAASSASTKFMFAAVFISIWPFTSWLALVGSALFAVWGAVALYKQSRRTPAPDRGRVFMTGVVSALVFVAIALLQIGYSAGKYMALQDNATCSAFAQSAPNSSFQRTRCARR